MDKTPVFFDMVPEKSLVQKGQKSVTIRTSGSEKRHVTVVLTVAADGFILPPMINFEVKLIKLSKILKHLSLRVLLLLQKVKNKNFLKIADRSFKDRKVSTSPDKQYGQNPSIF